MLDMFLFETSQNIEQLETTIISSEKSDSYNQETINEIFRIMHTIKGSAAMMLFHEISTLAHSMEDIFYYLREEKPHNVDCSRLSDLVLEGVDFIKNELQKIRSGDKADGDSSLHITSMKEFLAYIKQGNSSGNDHKKAELDCQQHYYTADEIMGLIHGNNAFKATIFFEEGCEMENIRAYTILHNLKEITSSITYQPNDILENDESIQVIREKGFTMYIKTEKSYDEMNHILQKTIFLKELDLVQLENEDKFELQVSEQSKKQSEQSLLNMSQFKSADKKENTEVRGNSTNQSIISVNVAKLDKLMDLVGEMVIAEAMVTENPDIKDLELENFQKAARQLHKITSELQDMVMSIRMVPLATTFHKMHRIVRDMNKKLDKDVHLKLIGEETEVDKNIIEHISDPLMHLVRNSIDHGIETTEERTLMGKPKSGRITLEAKNAGSDVLVIVKDDGKGLNKEKILTRARENNLLAKPENEMTDKEVYQLISLPGFSTKDNITEFSGRGVGMDVVLKNIEEIGGSISIDSIEGQGLCITLKIPLTLAIIDGMNVKVGQSRYTIPIISIKESFRPREKDILRDPDGNEMIMVRGQCYPIVRLHEYYNVKTEVTDFTEGILIMVEQDERALCIFCDELLGQQQVVVKALPGYIKNRKKIDGLAGCTLLGDGSISLIIDIGGFFNIRVKV
jgi:two-component system chemotaxis sensor kinase CheA